MKKKDFKDLLTSIGQARKIHAGKLKLPGFLSFIPSLLKGSAGSCMRRKLPLPT